MIKQAIEVYYNKINVNSDYCKGVDFSYVSKEIKQQFDRGKKLIKRAELTDITCFKDRFGIALPLEIERYINEYWHAWIYGYCNIAECIVLFSVLKREGDSVNEVIYYKNSLMDLSNRWSKIGNIYKYIPIGWLDNSGGFVLYDINTSKIYIEDVDANQEGTTSEYPIANSLEDLIMNLEIKRNQE